MKREDFTTTKFWKQTMKKLKIIAALTDRKIVLVIDQLADKELEKIGYKQNDQSL